jgi:hypothetical protein
LEGEVAPGFVRPKFERPMEVQVLLPLQGKAPGLVHPKSDLLKEAQALPLQEAALALVHPKSE